MIAPACQSPLEWMTLLGYWLGELDPETERGVEEHYLACDHCSDRLSQLSTLAKQVGAVARGSGVNMVINDALARRLSDDGFRVREYSVPVNGSVNCSVAPEDDFVMARLQATLAGLKRIDLIFADARGTFQTRLTDIPFIPDSDGVVFAASIETVRALPESTIQMRLLAVGKDGERTIGEYTLNHTPYAARTDD